MTAYPPINPNGKPACWPQQHSELIAGLCDACGQHTQLYPIAEGPICGPAAICADCIWALTPRDPDQDRPLFAIALCNIESRHQAEPVTPARISAPTRFLAPASELTQRPVQICERQLAFDFTVPPTRQRRQAEKTMPQPLTGAQPLAPSIAPSDNVQSPPASDTDAAAGCVNNGVTGIACDGCGQLIRIYLDNAVVSSSGERCCLDCFEAEYNLEPFIVTAAWLDEHRAELEQDWRFVDDVAELMPRNSDS